MLKVNQSVADCEFLEKLADAVQQNIFSGKGTQSPFEVITKQDFDTMSEADLQLLFRDKHIVVKDIPHAKRVFNRRSLEMLGSWEQPRTFQGV